jgi:hypothetical protein
MTETAPATIRPARKSQPSNVLIRPWPKVIFFYPTFVAATVFWFWSMIKGDVGSTTGVPGLGNWFCAFLFLNLLVFSFDFSRIKSITILLGVVAVIAVLAWANTKWEIVTGLSRLLDKVDIRANTQFFGFVSGFFALVFLLVLVNTRFNYYEINHREILHHHGYLGDITRWPTANLRHSKEIYDLLEFLLLRSGRLIFFPASRDVPIVVDNVINVNHVESRIKELMSVIAVREFEEDEGGPAIAEAD